MRRGVAIIVAAAAGAVTALCGDTMNLAGTWAFTLDPQDRGIAEMWPTNVLPDTIGLPGTTDAAKRGMPNPNPPTLDGLYRPNSYEGVAWYQRDIEIPGAWKGMRVTLFLERVRWATQVWLDGEPVGTVQDSLIAPHEYDLGTDLAQGRHRLTIRVDNTARIALGPFVSALYGGTPGNLNGIVGRIELNATAPVWIDDVQVYADMERKCAVASVRLGNATGKAGSGTIVAAVASLPTKAVSAAVGWGVTGGTAVLSVPLGDGMKLWDEFTPNLYTLHVSLVDALATVDTRTVTFGMRSFAACGTQFTLNNRPVFLRGTLECHVFPLEGVPPTDVPSWQRIYRTIKSYGLNYMRFHSWCPPEAAFAAADIEGVMLQAEAPRANVNAGDNPRRDAFTEAELLRMVRTYGNHPSFCLMTLGNEYGGADELLTRWVGMLIKADPRHLYTSPSCGQSTTNRQFTVTGEGRGVHGEGTQHDIRRVVASDHRHSPLLPAQERTEPPAAGQFPSCVLEPGMVPVTAAQHHGYPVRSSAPAVRVVPNRRVQRLAMAGHHPVFAQHRP